jgi:hypothetical protein
MLLDGLFNSAEQIVSQTYLVSEYFYQKILKMIQKQCKSFWTKHRKSLYTTMIVEVD